MCVAYCETLSQPNRRRGRESSVDVVSVGKQITRIDKYTYSKLLPPSTGLTGQQHLKQNTRSFKLYLLTVLDSVTNTTYHTRSRPLLINLKILYIYSGDGRDNWIAGRDV